MFHSTCQTFIHAAFDPRQSDCPWLGRAISYSLEVCNQGWVQLHKITSITITLKYKFQLQLHLHNVILNYNYTMFITITDQFFSRKLYLYLWNFLLIDLGCFPDIWYHIMCGTRNHRKQGYSIILDQNAHVNLLFFFT